MDASDGGGDEERRSIEVVHYTVCRRVLWFDLRSGGLFIWRAICLD